MAKQDYIPAGIQPFMVWHDQFKTAVLASAAIPRLRDLVAGDTTQGLTLKQFVRP